MMNSPLFTKPDIFFLRRVMQFTTSLTDLSKNVAYLQRNYQNNISYEIANQWNNGTTKIWTYNVIAC